MKQANFIGQRQGEKVLFTFRRHIISIRRGIYGFMIATVVFSLPFLCFPEKTALLWLVLVGLFIGFVYLFYTWIGWYFTCYIVTNERIRELRQKGLFNKTVIDLNLDKVQNVSYNISGFAGSMFGFGTIILQTMVGNMIINQAERCESNYSKLSLAVRRSGGKIDSE